MKIRGAIITKSDRRIAAVALLAVGLDQSTKHLVGRLLHQSQEKVLVDGFFKLVNWENTGAAWSLFQGKNGLLAVLAVIALAILIFSRRHLGSQTLPGQTALGLILGGIIGNLIDRLTLHHVVDFIYFYIGRNGGGELGFPAFNVADSSICIGVGLIFLAAWKNERLPQ
jgi:signal peptidase II